MKKLLGIMFLFLLFSNDGSANNPKLGMATFGFSCDPILGSAKETEYLGFLEEDEFFFEIGLDKEENEFFFFSDSPLFFESLNDKDNSLENVYIWYDLFYMNGKVFPILFHNIFYFDKNKKKYFYKQSHMKYENKKIMKAAKSQAKFQEMSFDEIDTKKLKKIQNGFTKINKSLYKIFSPSYGSPISAKKLLEFGGNLKNNVYICQKL
jgi:hypothetical protein